MSALLRNKLIIILVIMLSLQIAPERVCAKNDQTLLIDDFDKGSFFNSTGGQAGGDEESPGTCKPSFVSSDKIVYGHTGNSLQLDYDVNLPGTYSFFWAKLGKDKENKENGTEYFNIGPYKYLSFYIKSKDGGQNVKIEIHQDADNNNKFDFENDITSYVYASVYLNEIISKNWQKVVIPIKDFKNLKNKKKILELVFVVEHNFNKKHPKGTLFIDNLLLGTNYTPQDKNPPPSPLRYSFKINNKLLKDKTTFKPPISLQVEAPSISQDKTIENVHFMYKTEQSDFFKTIGYDYDTKDTVYKITWPAANLPTNTNYILQAVAEDAAGNKTRMILPITECKIEPLTDKEFINLLAKRSFEYFLDFQNEETGLIADNSQGGYTSIASTGFGLAAYTVGAKRGWINKAEAKKRIEKTLDTFIKNLDSSKDIVAEGKDGFFYHFLDPHTAKRAGDCEVSTIDTAILAAGAITAGEYFGGQIKEKAEELYKNINWQSFYNDDMQLFEMGYSPEKGYFDRYWSYFTDEVVIISLLATASPTYPIEPESYYSFTREKGSYKDIGPFIYSFNGALFCHQYAHMWFNFKGKEDQKGVNWYQNSKLATLANRQFCIDNSSVYKTYGPNSWGISSFYLPEAYTMHFGAAPAGAGTSMHNGTVSPPAIAGSIIFTPKESFAALRNLFVQYPNLWGKYGLRNSFNLDRGFYAPVYYGIDRGLMLLAIENFKDGFVQDTFMKSKYAKNSLENTGFENIKEKPKNPQKDYLVFIDSLKKQLPSLEDNKQKAILHYEIADNYLKYLETLRKNNLNSFRQYIETNDEYYKEALRNIDKSLSLSNDENLIIDSLLAKLIIYHHQFENKKTEKIYNKLSKRIKSTIDKKESQYSKLNQVLTAMQNHGLRKYAFRLQMDNIKRLPPELAKKRLVSLKEKADRHLKNDDISEAERIYEQYLKLSKSFYSNEKIPVIYHDVAKQYFNHKKYSTACKYYNAIIDKCSNYKKIDTVQFKLALSYEKQEDYKDAVKAYEKYIKYYPGALKINEVYIKLSDLYYVIGCGSKQALSSLQKLASSAPEKARPYIIINIAKTLYNMDEFDKAKEEFEKVIKLYPDNSQSYVAKNYIDKIKERNKKE